MSSPTMRPGYRPVPRRATRAPQRGPIEPSGRALGDYVVQIQRNVVVGVLCIGLGAVGGYSVGASRPVSYSATSTVLVSAFPSFLPRDSTAPKPRRVTIDTEGRLVTSQATAADVRSTTRDPASIDDVRSRISVDAPPNTRVLRISFLAGDPRSARVGAQAAALSYLGQRRTLLKKRHDDAVTSLDKASGVAQRRASQNPIDLAAVQVTLQNLQQERDRVNATSTNGGQVIRSATEPTATTANKTVPATSGALLGLLVAACAAIWRRRRIRAAADVRSTDSAPIARSADLPVRRIGRRVEPDGNRLLPLIGPRAQVVFVAPATSRRASTVGAVAAAIATAAARSGRRVDLVRIGELGTTTDAILASAPAEQRPGDRRVSTVASAAIGGATADEELGDFVAELLVDADLVVLASAHPLDARTGWVSRRADQLILTVRAGKDRLDSLEAAIIHAAHDGAPAPLVLVGRRRSIRMGHHRPHKPEPPVSTVPPMTTVTPTQTGTS